MERETGANRLKTVRFKTGVFKNKVEIYTTYRKAASWKEDFPEYDLDSFRVLVVSDSTEKIANRLEVAKQMKKSGLFQFATIQAVSVAANMFTEPIWKTPAGKRILLHNT
ncbi:hypothetical protein GWN26_03390 [Candidatus Saccharibacteria bacterium]|nr:hypothetical protein [Candidatus Saccharibacteria bacterium]NIV03403.1 hypothetical protein [Calditrichia bacterium]NIV71609.1 hypothetical protein [Calditrichia bacterium]NIV98227.1 hypothetical protein [Candidatus Saccharibacteria bacterium]NIW78431.1 hypothetical protein [Calditrichia bacterium]